MIRIYSYLSITKAHTKEASATLSSLERATSGDTFGTEVTGAGLALAIFADTMGLVEGADRDEIK
jgi:hypothetical protein